MEYKYLSIRVDTKEFFNILRKGIMSSTRLKPEKFATEISGNG